MAYVPPSRRGPGSPDAYGGAQAPPSGRAAAVSVVTTGGDEKEVVRGLFGDILANLVHRRRAAAEEHIRFRVLLGTVTSLVRGQRDFRDRALRSGTVEAKTTFDSKFSESGFASLEARLASCGFTRMPRKARPSRWQAHVSEPEGSSVCVAFLEKSGHRLRIRKLVRNSDDMFMKHFKRDVVMQHGDCRVRMEVSELITDRNVEQWIANNMVLNGEGSLSVPQKTRDSVYVYSCIRQKESRTGITGTWVNESGTRVKIQWVEENVTNSKYQPRFEISVSSIPLCEEFERVRGRGTVLNLFRVARPLMEVLVAAVRLQNSDGSDALDDLCSEAVARVRTVVREVCCTAAEGDVQQHRYEVDFAAGAARAATEAAEAAARDEALTRFLLAFPCGAEWAGVSANVASYRFGDLALPCVAPQYLDTWGEARAFPDPGRFGADRGPVFFEAFAPHRESPAVKRVRVGLLLSKAGAGDEGAAEGHAADRLFCFDGEVCVEVREGAEPAELPFTPGAAGGDGLRPCSIPPTADPVTRGLLGGGPVKGVYLGARFCPDSAALTFFRNGAPAVEHFLHWPGSTGVGEGGEPTRTAFFTSAPEIPYDGVDAPSSTSGCPVEIKGMGGDSAGCYSTASELGAGVRMPERGSFDSPAASGPSFESQPQYDTAAPASPPHAWPASPSDGAPWAATPVVQVLNTAAFVLPEIANARKPPPPPDAAAGTPGSEGGEPQRSVSSDARETRIDCLYEYSTVSSRGLSDVPYGENSRQYCFGDEPPSAAESSKKIDDGLAQEYLIPYDRLSNWTAIGKGRFGEVFKCEYSVIGETVAVKRLAPHVHSRRGSFSSFQEEIRTLLLFRSRHILSGFGWTTHGETLYMITDYCDGGGFLELLNGIPLDSEERVVRVLACSASVARALGVIHDQFTKVHLDVAARNVLLCTRGGGDFDYKLADVGLAADIGSPLHRFCVPWSPPEIVQAAESQRKATVVHDFWSLGCLIYEGLEGPPFREGARTEEQWRNTAADKLRRNEKPAPPAHLLTSLRREVWEFISGRLWDVNPDTRLCCGKDVAKEVESLSKDYRGTPLTDTDATTRSTESPHSPHSPQYDDPTRPSASQTL